MTSFVFDWKPAKTGQTISKKSRGKKNMGDLPVYWMCQCNGVDVQFFNTLDDYNKKLEQGIICGIFHKTKAGSQRHCNRLNTIEDEKAKRETRKHLRAMKEVSKQPFRLPETTDIYTRDAWKDLLFRSGPAWTIAPRDVHLKVIRTMAKRGLLEVKGDDEFVYYRLTDYGIWCRNRWIYLKMKNKYKPGHETQKK